MTAAQMLAAAGEPNTKAGRANFHKRFKDKQAFDAWYNSKKEYGGGLTDGIAFPQQPDASSRRVPYYDKGGIFAPNVMPWNGPIGFYEHGGMTNEIAFPQQPTEHINFSAFPWKPKYNMGGLPGGANNMPCFECGGYMQPGGYVQAPDADAYFAAQDAAANYPAQGTNINYDYSKVTNPNTPLLNNYTVDELNMMGANIPVANSAQDQRFKKIAEYNENHPYIPAGGGLYKRSSGQDDQRFQYVSGKYTPYTGPAAPVAINNKYGGYMQTGGTTEMEQNDYTNAMTNQFLNSINSINQFNQETMPSFDEAEEAGVAAYGYEMPGNTDSDFNTLDMDAANQMSNMQDRLDYLQGSQSDAFGNFGRGMMNIGRSFYKKPTTYKTKTVGSGMMMYGGIPMAQSGFENRVKEILMKGQPGPTFGQTKTVPVGSGTININPNIYRGNAAQAAANAQTYTPEQLAAFQAMLSQYMNQAYAPSYQAYDPRNQFGMAQLLGNSALKDIAWKGYGRKGKATFRTFYDPSTGKTISVPTEEGQTKTQRSYDSTKTGEEAKGPGFFKRLLEKGKQRKAERRADKRMENEMAMREKESASNKKILEEQRLNAINAKEADDWFNQRLAENALDKKEYENQRLNAINAAEADVWFNKRLEENSGQKFPNPSGFPSYAPPVNTNPMGFPTFNRNISLPPATPIPSYAPGFEYGGFPQYDFGGYPQYAIGGEAEMDEDEIANFLAMGGTLEYLD